MQINFEPIKIREAHVVINKLKPKKSLTQKIDELAKKDEYYQKEEAEQSSFFKRILKAIFK